MAGRYDYPDKRGKITLFPEYLRGGMIGVKIVGTPEGLRYLAEILNWLADYDQEGSELPDGEREHIHLHPIDQLEEEYSCEVEICRADAKGTGELSPYVRL